jgi:hypothetical protein
MDLPVIYDVGDEIESDLSPRQKCKNKSEESYKELA